MLIKLSANLLNLLIKYYLLQLIHFKKYSISFFALMFCIFSSAGILVEGFGSFLAGALGTGGGTTSCTQNIGIITLTRVISIYSSKLNIIIQSENDLTHTQAWGKYFIYYELSNVFQMYKYEYE